MHPKEPEPNRIARRCRCEKQTDVGPADGDIDFAVELCAAAKEAEDGEEVPVRHLKHHDCVDELERSLVGPHHYGGEDGHHEDGGGVKGGRDLVGDEHVRQERGQPLAVHSCIYLV